MPLDDRGPYERRDEIGAPLLKRRYSTAIGSSNVKTVADRHRHAAFAKECIATKWIEIDQDCLRTGTVIGSRTSHEH